MPLPNSGPLSLNDIQTEFGGTNPISLNEYYAGGALVPAGTSGINGPVPSSGAISISNFYGTTAFIPFGQASYTTPGTYTYTVPAGISSISAVAIGGASACARYGATGGGALSYTNGIPVTPGEALTVIVGRGGIKVTGSGVPADMVATASSIRRGGTTLLLADFSIVSNFNAIFSGTSNGVPGLASNGIGAVRNSGGQGILPDGQLFGGGGAAGYSGNGGFGGRTGSYNAGNGSGGGGGGGGGGGNSRDNGGGGGVGINGEGASGVGGNSAFINTVNGARGGGGSGGTGGAASPNYNAGVYGGGAGSDNDTSSFQVTGGGGAIRIIWGTGKSYPFNAT